MKATLSDDRGAVAVVVAICIVVLMTIAAFAVDLGMWYTARSQLQSAADAAALAGCRALADGKSDGEVWDQVRTYAHANFKTPVEDAKSTVVAPTGGGLSDIGADYVKVTVRTDSPSFFARLLGYEKGDVAAQAVARVGYLRGARAPVPWGLMVLHVGQASASMGCQTVTLSEGGDGWWESQFAAGHSGAVSITARNSLGYDEVFPSLVSVGSLPSSSKFAAIDVERTTFTSGSGPCQVDVTLAGSWTPPATVKASIGGGASTTLTRNASTGKYSGSLAVPTTSDPFERVTLSVTFEAGSGKNKVTETKSCGILVRRANYIIRDVEVEPAFARPGDPVSIRMRTLDFEYGVAYQLKVEGGAGSLGNFGALDLGSLDHSDCGYPDTPDAGGSGGSGYRENIIGNPDLIAHVNDWVDTKPGNMVGPTRQGIDGRLDGVTMVTLSQWEAADRPETKQILIVPICEKPSAINGKKQLKIVSFATFFLEEKPGSNEAVLGEFVEYTAPGWIVGEDPGGGLVIKAVHLVSDHLDF